MDLNEHSREKTDRDQAGINAAMEQRTTSHLQEATETNRSNFQDSMEHWKGLYDACRSKLGELQATISRGEASQASQSWLELQAEMEATARTLSEEHAHVEAALERHNAVLLSLLRRLQPVETMPPQEHGQGAVSQETIAMLKRLIIERDLLSASVEEERSKLGFVRGERARTPQEPAEGAQLQTEEELRRTSSLLQLQVKRLQYELSRLTQAQAIETQAVLKLIEQSEADLKINTTLVEEMVQSNQKLRDGESSYRQGCRVVDTLEQEQEQRCRELRERLNSRLHSDRVYREVDHLDDEADVLASANKELSRDIAELNEAERTLERQWHALRVERDELTAHLYPDLQRLQELQEIAKERLELETKLRKENFLFRKQLEDFQKDLLEVETDLLTGNVSCRTRATKNIVTQLNVLRDTLKEQNNELWTEMEHKSLTIRSDDSLASAKMTEDECRQHITSTMKKMELRIKEDLDRRALFKPKKYVFEAPSKAKVPFRGQRNVIKLPSKVAADWRRKTTTEIHREERMEQQVEKLRRDILDKLALEKEKAKRQLLQYDSEQHGAMAADEDESEVIPDDKQATLQLRSILGQLDTFLHRGRARAYSGRLTTDIPGHLKEQERSQTMPQSASNERPEDDFGSELKTLIFQLEKLQSALEGSGSRERESKHPGLSTAMRRRALFEQLPEANRSR